MGDECIQYLDIGCLVMTNLQVISNVEHSFYSIFTFVVVFFFFFTSLFVISYVFFYWLYFFLFVKGRVSLIVYYYNNKLLPNCCHLLYCCLNRITQSPSALANGVFWVDTCCLLLLYMQIMRCLWKCSVPDKRSMTGQNIIKHRETVCQFHWLLFVGAPFIKHTDLWSV